MAVFVFMAMLTMAQKKYDCIVFLKDKDRAKNTRIVGRMTAIEDSSFTLLTKKEELTFNWNNVSVVKFRMHNGYMRSVLPIIFGTSAAFGLIAYIGTPANDHSAFFDKNAIGPVIFVVTSISNIFFCTPIYFIARNHKFRIHSYNDFLKLKQSSSKYIFK
jgi:hypothetical protein